MLGAQRPGGDHAAEHQQTSWPLLNACPARPYSSNTPTPVNPTSLLLSQTNSPGLCFAALYEMDPPNLGALDLSDSDTDALFDTPAARKAKKKTKDEADAGNTAASGKARAKESHYTTEEAREGALRRELESIRNVNKVIEGVIESLQKAKDNMAVRAKRAGGMSPGLMLLSDRITYRSECIDLTPDMDPYTIPDRTQPAPHPEPAMAGCIAGPD